MTLSVAEAPPDLAGVVLGLLGFLALELFLNRRFRRGRGWDQRRLVASDADVVPLVMPGLNKRSAAEHFVRGGMAARPAIVSIICWLAFMGSAWMASRNGSAVWGLACVILGLISVATSALAAKEWVRPSDWNHPPAWLAETRWWHRFRARGFRGRHR